MNECLNGGTHGPVHILIGGAWETTEDAITWTTSLDNVRSSIRVLLFKMLWRTGFTRCPTNCTSTGTSLPRALSVPASLWLYMHLYMHLYLPVCMLSFGLLPVDSCSCSVPPTYIEEYGASYILNYTGITDAINSESSYTFTNDSAYLDLLEAIQDPGVVGDMLTSSGTPIIASSSSYANAS